MTTRGRLSRLPISIYLPLFAIELNPNTEIESVQKRALKVSIHLKNGEWRALIVCVFTCNCVFQSSYNAALAFKNKSEEANEDENLKWVEEHIPTAGFDSAIDPTSTLDDSDEDQIRTQQTINKMH